VNGAASIRGRILTDSVLQENRSARRIHVQENLDVFGHIIGSAAINR
jgi:hypothetical protein